MPSHADATLNREVADCRADYVAPDLRDLGDVRDLTLGGSPGNLDSGNSGVEQPPGFRRAPKR
jgi:hypothetical protein